MSVQTKQAGPCVGKTSSGRILSVEIGRGLAALAVVVFHANIGSRIAGGPYISWLNMLEHGVDFFFVLSGFIIFTAHADDIGKEGEVSFYVRKRLIRIFPLLWAIVFGYAALRWLAGDPVDVLTIVRSAIPYPSLEEAAPLVVWTLRHELLFYAIFAIVIWRPGIGWPIILVWSLTSLGPIFAIATGFDGIPSAASMILSSFTLDFLMGIALAALYRHRRFAARWWPLIAAIAFLAATLALTHVFHLKRHDFSDYVSMEAALWVPVLGAAFTAVVYGLLCIESAVSPSNWLIRLGSASYAIYLVHTPVSGIVLGATAYLPQNLIESGALLPVLTVAGVWAGFIMHRFYEKPVSARLARLMGTQRGNKVQPGGTGTVSVAHAKRMADTKR